MSRAFNLFFYSSSTLINWLFSEGLFGMKKAGNIITVLFLFSGVILGTVDSSNEYVSRLIVGMLMIFMFFLFFIGGFKFFWIKPPRFIRGNSQNPTELFNTYSHRAYIYGVLVFSFCSSYFSGGIILVLTRFYLELNYDFPRMFYYLFFISSSVFTVFYFMYHIVVNQIPIKEVKSRISLYLAIAASLTAGVFGLQLKEMLTPMITFLVLGFGWLKYFIDKVDCESSS